MTETEGLGDRMVQWPVWISLMTQDTCTTSKWCHAQTDSSLMKNIFVVLPILWNILFYS